MIRVEIPPRGPLPFGLQYAKTELLRLQACGTCLYADTTFDAEPCMGCTVEGARVPSNWTRDPSKPLEDEPTFRKAPQGSEAQRAAIVAEEEQHADDHALNAGVLGRAEHAARRATRRAKLREAQGLPPLPPSSSMTVGEIASHFGVPMRVGASERIGRALAAMYPDGVQIESAESFAQFASLVCVMDEILKASK